MQTRKLIPVTILLTLLVVVSIFEVKREEGKTQFYTAETPVCLDGNECKESTRLNVEFKDFPIKVEEEVWAKIYLDSGWKLKRGWIEGVNMYMGKTPLLIEAESEEKNEYEVIFFLGSCTEPQMHWRLVTEWSSPDSKEGSYQSVTAFYDFNTSR